MLPLGLVDFVAGRFEAGSATLDAEGLLHARSGCRYISFRNTQLVDDLIPRHFPVPIHLDEAEAEAGADAEARAEADAGIEAGVAAEAEAGAEAGAKAEAEAEAGAG